jgi:hypothetical protein
MALLRPVPLYPCLTVSRFWRVTYRIQYRLLAIIDPLVVRFWRRFGVGNVIALEVARRDGRGLRTRLLGLLRAGGAEYIGHPNGHVGWTRDLAAAGAAALIRPGGDRRTVVARQLDGDDPERERAILATGQHPFPGNLMYRLGRRHIRAVGVFFRLDDG